jgi:hypothetical protein
MKKNSDKIIDELGKALRFGLMTELPGLIDENNGIRETHLCASIAFLHLNGYISHSTVCFIHNSLVNGIMGNKSLQELIKDISRELFDELLDKFKFTTFEEAVNVLNDIKIPKWYFDMGVELFDKMLEGMILIDDKLYYIAEDNDKTLFVNVDLNDYDSTDALDEQDDKVILGYDYSRIYGYDNKNHRIYLGVKNQQEFYHYYDLDSNEFTIESDRLIAVKKGIPFIISKNGYFSYIVDGKVNMITQSHDDYEEYLQKKDYFLVVPKSIFTPYFYPYCISYEGKLRPAEDKECKEYLWSVLENVGKKDDALLSELFNESIDEKKFSMPDRFTIDAILNAFNDNTPENEQNFNVKFRMFESICIILSKYINPDEDITKLLYELYDANRIVAKTFDEFPSEELYLRLRKIQSREANKNILKEIFEAKDYDLLKDMIVGDTPDIIIKDRVGMIGEFCFDENSEIKTFAIYKNQGLVVGNMIVSNVNLETFQGTVTYNCSTGIYYITSARVLSGQEKNIIIKNFKLSDSNYIFIIQAKEESECEILNYNKELHMENLNGGD